MGHLIFVDFTFTRSIAYLTSKPLYWQDPHSSHQHGSILLHFSAPFSQAFLAQNSKFRITAIQLAEQLKQSFHYIHHWQGLSWRIRATVKNCISEMKLPSCTSPANNQRPRKFSLYEKFEWMVEEKFKEWRIREGIITIFKYIKSFCEGKRTT